MNLDLLEEQKNKIYERMTKAISENKPEDFGAAFEEFTSLTEQAVLAEANARFDEIDQKILMSRGARVLTSEETKFYNGIIDALKASGHPQQALTGTDVVLPKTVINSVFEDMKEAHPLLDLINFQDTAVLIDLLASSQSGVAVWGEITANITGELSAAFTKVEMGQKMLTAFMVINKSLLKLGPVWLDRYVREVLVEALSAECEAGIVDGDGDDKPIGMTRQLTGAVDGVFPRKSAVIVKEFDPATYGSILATLATGPNGKSRVIPEVLMVVSTSDYFNKVFPATTVRRTDGTFSTDVFPYPTRVVPSAAVPAGHAVVGIAKRYVFGVGNGEDGKIEYADQYQFIQNNRVYAIFFFGTGRAKDENAFVYLDISGLQTYVQKVYVTNASESTPLIVEHNDDARIASLDIGGNAFTPTFNKDVYAGYAVDTDNAADAILALPMHGDATVEILNGVTAVANGAEATWAEGENTVTINVTDGDETKTYTITVTYTPAG